MKREVAIKILKELHDGALFSVRNALETLIPELAESEDERIRTFLHHTFIAQYLCKDKTGKWHGEPVTNILAYLENQKEQKPTAEEILAKAGLKPYKDGNQWCILVGDNIQEGICGFGDTIDEALYQLLKDVLEKQKEPEHFELKAGHWYICHHHYCCRADRLTIKEGERFMCEKNGIVMGFIIKEPEKYFIECGEPSPVEDEQKPADNVPKEKYVKRFKVLCDAYEIKLPNREYDIYHLCNDLSKRFTSSDEQKSTEWSDSVAKEMFIKALERAVEQTKKGYELTDCGKHSWWEDFKAYSEIKSAEWSENDKEMLSSINQWLNEIEPQYVKKEQAWLNALPERFKLQSKKEWSEEDEDTYKRVSSLFEQAIDRWYDVVFEGCYPKITREKVLSMLKSLHPQSRWKPSNEQMNALAWHSGNNNIPPVGDEAIKSLYNDLTKLM